MLDRLRIFRSSSYAAFLLALTTLGCAQERVSAPGPGDAELKPGRPPIVLISIDTLRSDRLPAYGYTEGSTPAIDALVRDGVVYEHAYSHAPLTLPSHASLLTGLLPPEHGVRDNMGYRFETGLDRPYLPLLLREAGYATGAAVSAFVLRSEAGLATGFDFYDDESGPRVGPGLGGVQRPGLKTLAVALSWLDRAAASEQPFFLFLHLFEPHAPYTPPAPFADRFADPYDGEIAAADEVVGRLVERLRTLDLYDEALIVLLSDHGEGLGDHGEQEHGIFLYREAIQVPLIVKWPGASGERPPRAGTRIAAPAQLIDFAPTLAEVTGLSLSPRWQGRSWWEVSAASDEAPEIYSETFHPRLQYGWSELTSLVRWPHHLIYGPDPELYDLAADPAEKRNVRAEERRVLAETMDWLENLDNELAPPQEVDAETARRLAALGYVGSGSRAGDGPLPDPKTQLGVLEELKAAFQKFESEDWAAAAADLERLTAAQPGMVRAWDYLGRALHRLGLREAALEAYRRALELAPTSPEVLLQATAAFIELGRLAEAREHAELALDAQPVDSHILLGKISLAEEDFAAAESSARSALGLAPRNLSALLLLATALNRLERPEEALAAAERGFAALAEDPDLEHFEGLHLERGDALARLGESERAEADLREEIRLFPRHLRAYQQLATLYAVLGRGAEAGATLQRMVESVETPAAYLTAAETLRVWGDERSAEALLRLARRKFPDRPELR